MVGPVQTSYTFTIPFLDQQVMRDASLHDASLGPQKPEKAEFEIPWITSPGFPVFWAALLSMGMLRLGPRAIYRAFLHHLRSNEDSDPDNRPDARPRLRHTLRRHGRHGRRGIRLHRGAMYPFFGTMLGWVGVFLTGTDAGSNALFGSLQKITATKVHQAGWMSQLNLGQAQVSLILAHPTAPAASWAR